jgi:YidC/Oxa1 family membrane protein insertase
MERRFVVFLILSFVILVASSALMPKRKPAPQPAPKQLAVDQEKKPTGPEADKKKPASTSEKPANKAASVIQAAPEPESPEQWVTLGSAASDSPYRMLVTLTTEGAAVARIELNSPRYCDIDDRSGYLGHLILAPDPKNNGCRVRLVGPGTPAAEAGLKSGDIITAINQKSVADPSELDAVLKKTKPKQFAELEILRDGKKEKLPQVKLRRRPLDVIQPEDGDPMSMLMTLQQFDDAKISYELHKLDETDAANPSKEAEHYIAYLNDELEGVKLRTANWKLIHSTPSEAQFRRSLPEKGLEITKTYRLVHVPDASLADEDYPAYHLEFDIEIRNTGDEAHKIAYRLDGPNGLPTEGAWYATRVTRTGGSGIRDYIISFDNGTPAMTGAMSVSYPQKLPGPSDEQNKLLTFIGVDAQYFSAVLMPQRQKANDIWFDALMPIRVGKVDLKHTNLTNTSCRLIGKVQELAPGKSLVQQFRFFAGPKKPAILENPEYKLGELVYFGWPIFAMVAKPLTVILHWFYLAAHNYGLAIIMLTILVRGCMFPLSLKQTAGAQKMQQLQPEIKKIQEKHKSNAEARTKAQQELFRKHNYNPLAGCLPVFIQLPVFLGLYRALMVSIELRDAPLITHSIRWCSNLAAPDMLYNWSWFIPAWCATGLNGVFSLGPYFNLLPILTIILFIGQQKLLMPPAVDEQAALQQKMMQYMMIFFGVMFFKVASGLCIYFIASSLWGLGERQFLPKAPAPSGSEPETRAEAKARERQAAEKGKK